MFRHTYHNITAIENLLATWERFLRGKRHKKDVVIFQTELASNLARLQCALQDKTYTHGPYSAFNISDPKLRHIHKASVRDRVLHHLIYKEFYPYFDRRFIYDVYSCRKDKGAHLALDRFKYFAGKVSKNHTRTCYVLKCDIKKFFASVDHGVLMKILFRHVADSDLLWLTNKVLSSFYAARPGVGLPLGNLTSQLFANIYLHELDLYLKQELKVKYYIRYGDDFVILSESKKYSEELLPQISNFLSEKLRLKLHPEKVFIKTLASGVDFLGWVHFQDYRVLRTSTKRRMIKRLKENSMPETINSYLGLLKHGDTNKIAEQINTMMYHSN